MNSQKRAGVAVSYVNTALHMAIGLFFTPFLLSSLGDAEYGVYRIMSSLAGQLLILNFGIGVIASRYVAQYNALQRHEEKENFLFMVVCLAGLLAVLVVAVGWALHFGIDALFERGLTSAELGLAKTLYSYMIATVAVSVFRDVFKGVISGEERFIVANGMVLVGLLLRIVTLVGLLLAGFGSVAIVATDLGIAVLLTLAQIAYSRLRLRQRIRFRYFDWVTIRHSLTFAGALLLQGIVNQVNMNVDTLILGAVLTQDVTRTVTMYSLALTLFTMYQGLTGVMGSVFTPQAVGMVVREASTRELTDLVIRVGRYQMMVAGAVLGGFLLLGREFIALWVGPAYGAAYLPALIVMIPVTVPLVQSVAIAVLDAQLKRMVRSIVLVVMAVLNVIVSVVLVRWIGYMGAAIGTALSVFLGHGVFMNFYYHRYIGLEVPRMFAEMLRGILPTAVVTTVVCIPAVALLPDTAVGFAAKVGLFLGLYAALLYHRGMNREEIGSTFGAVRKLLVRG